MEPHASVRFGEVKARRERAGAAKAHWDFIFATEFTTVEVWTRSGLVKFYVIAVMPEDAPRPDLRDHAEPECHVDEETGLQKPDRH